MIECTDPQLIREGVLMAFLEGEVDPSIRAHVESCPACASKVKELQQMSRTLQTGLYRIACPSPEELMKFQDGTLPPAERLVVAAHLRDCPVCPRELAELVATEESRLSMVTFSSGMPSQ